MFVLRRVAARAVLIDDDRNILLIRAHDPANPRDGHWWELPGGGIDPGETAEDTCLRELQEEAGIRTAEVIGTLWAQHGRFQFGGLHFDQHETVHLAHTSAPTDLVATHLEALEVQSFEAVRWWTLDDLCALPDRTIPTRLAELLVPVLGGEKIVLPDEPIDITNPDEWTW